jgi:hypothetical protein
MSDRNVTDNQGRVWRRTAIPDGVTLANGLSKEIIDAEIKKSKERRKEQERNARSKAARKAAAKRAKARKEWEDRPQILYSPMGNKR